MNIEAMIDGLIAREGGYVDHPADRGGATNWGITQAVARAEGYVGDMRSLSRGEAARIYRRLYWERPGFDQIAKHAPLIAAEMFDTGVNMGPPIAIGFLQRALNALNRSGSDYLDIIVDRQCGDKTIAALNTFLRVRGAKSEAVLRKAIEALQGERYIALTEQRPANEAFAYGWIANRIG
ncbi:MAG: glycosyl hydrolase 108 family protein [Sphingobium sp.]